MLVHIPFIAAFDLSAALVSSGMLIVSLGLLDAGNAVHLTAASVLPPLPVLTLHSQAFHKSVTIVCTCRFGG